MATTRQALKKLLHGLSSPFPSRIPRHHQSTQSNNANGILAQARRLWSRRSYSSSSSSSSSHRRPPIVAYQVSSPPPPPLMIAQRRHYCPGTEDSKEERCWSCGRSRGCALVCPCCSAVQSPDPSITYFQIFDQDQKYEMDHKDLEAKYKALMKKLHPDLFHGKSKEERGNSAQLSALVTTAYDELSDPVSRATYLLKLQGVHVEEEGTVDDPELLLEVMELREALESNPDRETLEQLHKTANDRMMQWSNSFNNAFKEGNTALAVSSLQRMSYFGRLCEAIKRELL